MTARPDFTVPLKPLWPESAQLLPQHLQFRDWYVEDFLAFRLNGVAPHAWGLDDLVIDTASLAKNGVLRVLRASARFPSGAVAHISPGAPLERKLPALDVGRHAMAVSLGLALPSTRAPIASTDAGGVDAVRYARVPQRWRGDATALMPRLRLLVDDEGANRYERIPLARVIAPLSNLELDPTMLPPLLRTAGNAFLADIVSAVVEALSSRQAELLAVREARPLDLENFHPSHAEQILLLSAINQALAVLAGRSFVERLPPATLHATLAELLGAVEALARRREPSAIPEYRHDAAGPGFRAIADRLLAILPTVAHDAHRAFPLQRTAPATFSLTIEEPSLFRRRVYLVASGADEAWLQAYLTAHAKIASAATLPSIVQSAVRGAALAPEFEPPPSLPSSDRFSCLRVDTRSHYWADILAQGTVTVHVPNAPSELEISLYVLTGDR